MFKGWGSISEPSGWRKTFILFILFG